MTNENETAKNVATAKGAVTKARNALQEAIDAKDMGKVMELSAEVQSAETALARAEKLHEQATREQYVERIDESRTTVVTALNTGVVAEAIEVLRRAGIKHVDIEIVSEGNFTVSTRSGQKGVQPGTTRNVERYDVGGVEYTATQLINLVGSAKMPNHETRMEQIADGSLKRKDYAREIVEKLEGKIINPTS